MKILIMTGPLYPQPGNNANLIGKLIPFFLSEGHEVRLLSAAANAAEDSLPHESFGVPVYWATDKQISRAKRLMYQFISRIVDFNGWSDAISTLRLSELLRKAEKEFCPDQVLSTMEPFSSALSAVGAGSAAKTVYIMDPPACTQEGYARSTSYRNRMLSKILRKSDSIITTPFIKEALTRQGYTRMEEKTVCMGFPLIQKHVCRPAEDDIRMNPAKVNLLFCGWLNLEIRSPEYFLKIAAKMDERFCIWFVGRDCDLINTRFRTESKAEIMALPAVSYQAALNAMAHADILIGLSNFVPVHMPSKTMEYINAGKPFINFYRREDCPTLYYTRRWPACLNIHEESTDIEKAAAQTIEFCLQNRGKTVDTSGLEELFPDCSTRHIAERILAQFKQKS